VIALLFSLFAVHFAFGATYTIHEGWAFLLPAWVGLACLVGVAMDAWLGRGEAAPGLTAPPQQAANRLESVPRSQVEPAVSAGMLLRPGNDETICTCNFTFTPVRLRRLCWAASGLIVLVPVVLYAVAPWAVSGIARKATAAKAGPHYMLTPRQYLAYYLWPPKSGAGARAEWLEAALDSLPEGATVLLSPAHHAMAQYYRKVEGRRPDLNLRGVSRSVLVEALAGGRTVFVDRLTEVEALRREGRVLEARGCRGMWAVEDTERP